MTSIRVDAGTGVDPEDLESIRDYLQTTDGPYPDYVLQLSEVRLIAKPEELKECVDEALNYSNQFELLYLGRLGDGARLVKQNSRREHRACIIVPPLFKRSSQQKVANGTIVVYEERQGWSAILPAILAFLVVLGVAGLYLFRRRQKQTK
jgi:hypothetical protein